MPGSRRLILASASPRRAELLAAMGLEFAVVASGASEEHTGRCSPSGTAASLALAKALDVLAIYPDAVVLGADTIVVRGDPHGSDEAVYYGKPKDAEDARRMLRELSDGVHHVVSGAAVVWHEAAGLHSRIETVSTRVVFRPLDDGEIAAYVATGEPMDKAGAYAIQGGAAGFIERIEGDYYNVVGLSLASVRRLLRGLVRPAGRVLPVPPVPFPIVES